MEIQFANMQIWIKHYLNQKLQKMANVHQYRGRQRSTIYRGKWPNFEIFLDYLFLKNPNFCDKNKFVGGTKMSEKEKATWGDTKKTKSGSCTKRQKYRGGT